MLGKREREGLAREKLCDIFQEHQAVWGYCSYLVWKSGSDLRGGSEGWKNPGQGELDIRY